ncbi:response regulator [Magnetovibrio sp. PR-2]|uniref:response regulator n=1 Tax=Magnetovibrio sp. PR-2 TaxID=3120356 RepID=UPI002FCE5B4D
MNISRLRTNPGTRVLIANEDPLEAMALESLLRIERNCETRITTDMREVLAMHECWPFDMLFLDMQNETLDGLKVVDQLGHAIRKAELTLVALVHRGSEQVRLASLASGAVATLAKPIDHNQATAQINRAFSLMPVRANSF